MFKCGSTVLYAVYVMLSFFSNGSLSPSHGKLWKSHIFPTERIIKIEPELYRVCKPL